MDEWDMNVQRMVDFAERNLKGDITLDGVAERLGYSRWYCTRQFSRVMGMSLRSYLRGRRLTEAAIALGDAVKACDPGTRGLRWNPDLPVWQRHDPEGIGQAWCRPVMKA